MVWCNINMQDNLLPCIYWTMPSFYFQALVEIETFFLVHFEESSVGFESTLIEPGFSFYHGKYWSHRTTKPGKLWRRLGMEKTWKNGGDPLVNPKIGTCRRCHRFSVILWLAKAMKIPLFKLTCVIEGTPRNRFDPVRSFSAFRVIWLI